MAFSGTSDVAVQRYRLPVPDSQFSPGRRTGTPYNVFTESPRLTTTMSFQTTKNSRTQQRPSDKVIDGTAMQAMPNTANSTSLGAWKLSRQKETEKMGRRSRGWEFIFSSPFSPQNYARDKGSMYRGIIVTFLVTSCRWTLKIWNPYILSGVYVPHNKFYNLS